jgi:hypothetical protein
LCVFSTGLSLAVDSLRQRGTFLGVTQLRCSAVQWAAFCLWQHGTCRPFCVWFFRAQRGKTIHNEHEAYRSTEGAIRQLRTSYFYHGIPLVALQATSGIQATVSYHAVAGNIPQMRATA